MQIIAERATIASIYCSAHSSASMTTNSATREASPPRSVDSLHVTNPSTAAGSCTTRPAPLFRAQSGVRDVHQPSLFETYPLLRRLTLKEFEENYTKEARNDARFRLDSLVSVFECLADHIPLTCDLVMNVCLVDAHRRYWHHHGRYRNVTSPSVAKANYWPLRVVRVEGRDYQWSDQQSSHWDSVVSVLFQLVTLLTKRRPTLFSCVASSDVHNFCRNLMRNWALMLYARGYMAIPLDGLEESFNNGAEATHASLHVRREWRCSTARSKTPSLLRPRWAWLRTTGRRSVSASRDRNACMGHFPILYTHMFSGALQSEVAWIVPSRSPDSTCDVKDLYLLCWQLSWCISGELRKYLTRGADRSNVPRPALKGCLRNRAAALELMECVSGDARDFELLAHPNRAFAVQHGGLVVVPEIGNVPVSVWRGTDDSPRWTSDLPCLTTSRAFAIPKLMALDLLSKIPVPVPRPILVLQDELARRGVLFEDLIRSVRLKLTCENASATPGFQSQREEGPRPWKRIRTGQV